MVTTIPTKVGRACDRCRRNKSRCDAFRPCALCTRASVSCITDGTDHAHQAVESRDFADSPPSRKRRRQNLPENDGPQSVPIPLTDEESPLLSSAPRESQASADDRGDSAIKIAKNIYRLDSRHLDEEVLSAIPGADSPEETITHRHQKARLAPISTYLTNALPAENEISILITEYFDTVHWFSLVILEPRFRPRFDLIMRNGAARQSDEPFLLLLSTVLGMGAWYLSHKSSSRSVYWREWSRKLISNAELQITKLLENSSLLAIQTLSLLGSFYVYHGRPSLSFSLLGATIKSAQAIGLHHEGVRVSHLEAEERKRVWWTIYTWDRFASITYGRPLGINDKDCNVAMPENVKEDVRFPSGSNATISGSAIIFSSYQRSLNELYVIASPAIESLYSARGSESPRAAETYVTLLHSVSAELWRWRRDLPEELSIDLENDCPTGLRPGEKAHRLQALSLHLSFESLLIILHRPFLKQQLELVKSNEERRFSGSDTSPKSASADPAHTLGPYQWWDAAARTAKVTELSHLVELATSSHLISFLGLNLFNAAIVLVSMSLSDPLEDRAQKAKRAVANILYLQNNLGSSSTLSKQSSQVVHTLIELLLRRERDMILGPPVEPSSKTAPSHTRSAIPLDSQNKQHSGPVPVANEEMNNMDLASRLDFSLASVQQVFAAGQQLPYHGGTTQSTQQYPTSHPQGQTLSDIPFEYADSDWSATPFDPLTMEVNWNDMNLNVSDGVGWFWDASFNDMNFGQGNV